MTKPGYGTIDHPLGLADAMAGSGGRIVAGNTIYLRAGTYYGLFTCALVGTAADPIIIKPYNHEKVIIEIGMNQTGQYCHIYDMEIRFTNWEHRYDGEVAEAYLTPLGAGMTGVGNRFIGCIIHDLWGGGSWQTNQNGGFFDCLIYNNGCYRTVGEVNQISGHNIYTQNELEIQYHHNNILWGAYNYGYHCYTYSGLINNYDVRRNISFSNGSRQFASGGLGGQRTRTSAFENNCVYPGDNSWFKGSNCTFNNDYWGGQALQVDALSAENDYGNDAVAVVPDAIPDAPTSGKVIKVFPYDYQDYFAGWAHIAIFNWDEDDTVDVDVSTVTGLSIGDSYRLHGAMDYENDVVEGVVQADSLVHVDMRAISHSVIGRNGDAVHTVATTFPKFGCFILEKVA